MRGLCGTVAAVCFVSTFSSSSLGADAPLRSSPDGRPLTLVFCDDFQTFRPWNGHTGIWRTSFGDGTQAGLDRRSLPTNGELEIYVDPTLGDADGSFGLNPFEIRGGHLDITARPTPTALVPKLRNYPYVSGVITTQPSFSQLYGYFEMRAKIPGGKGLWPAFWLLPEDLSWPPEIDVMESVGDPTVVYATAHSNFRPPAEIEGHITPDEFHTFAVSWDSKRLIYYVDNKEIGEQDTPPDLAKPMYMLANLAVGGNWPGAPDDTTHFPAKLSIAYIRAYRFSND